jgi:tetratricopeptide (TPR) repeat protein
LEGETLGWFVAGSLLVVILIGIGFQILGRGGEDASATARAPALGATGSVDLSSMTPREAADRLFTRVMAAVEQGNDTEAMNFLPMAIDAYGLARPLDEDGLYHLALLQGASGDFSASLATAKEGLAGAPEHLLLLSSAAEAAKELGDEAAAVGYYTLLLDSWDREMAFARQEYTDHSRILPLLREDAERFLEGEGR